METSSAEIGVDDDERRLQTQGAGNRKALALALHADLRNH
jgi:hypothetical protein